jgi:5-methylcytosine-specific restriction protein A
MKQEYKKWLHTKRWRELRAKQLELEPWCQCPYHKGKNEPAKIVGHIKQHKGGRELFWDPDNLWSLADLCHRKYKEPDKSGPLGVKFGYDAQGNPLGGLDHWS